MNSHRYWFSLYEKYDGGMVYLGDDSPLSIVGHGKVLIKLSDGRVNGTSGVLYILGLTLNLLLVRTLNDAGV
jgi:hypothetical protein